MSHSRLSDAMQEKIENIEQKNKFNPTKTQAEEILQRYSRIRHIMQQAVSEPDPLQKSLFTEKLDNVLLHRRWGYLILLVVFFYYFKVYFCWQATRWIGLTADLLYWADGCPLFYLLTMVDRSYLLMV